MMGNLGESAAVSRVAETETTTSGETENKTKTGTDVEGEEGRTRNEETGEETENGFWGERKD